MKRIRVTGTAQSVEEISWKHLRSRFADRPDLAARLSGYVERVYAINPGLASAGQLIRVGTEILMPDPEPETPVHPSNRLWD